MSEINHPFIDPELQNIEPVTLAFEFAQAAHDVLVSYGHYRTTVADGEQVSWPVTERVDIMSDDPEVFTALRLKRVLAFAAAKEHKFVVKDGKLPVRTEDSPADGYFVIALEHGTVGPETAPQQMDEQWGPGDDDFTWRPYAVAVTDKTLAETYILDGNTGQIFSDGDIMQAFYGFNLLKNYLQEARFEETLDDDGAVAISVTKIDEKTRHLPFDAEEIREDNYGQHQCIGDDCPVDAGKHQSSYAN